MTLDRSEFGAALAGTLPAFLRTRRWFGGKGRVMTAAALADYAWLRAGEEAADCLAVVDVAYQDGATERYSLWLGLRPAAGDWPLVARTGGRAIVDVSTDPASGRALLRLVGEGRDLPTAAGGRLSFVDRSPVADRLLETCHTIEHLGAEQSNTSVRCGEVVFKWLRRLQPGEHPEVEIGRFLTTETSFRECPALHGVMTYHAPDGARSTAGMLQGWIDNLGDGWTYATRRIAAHVERPGSWATVREDGVMLGSATARFHRAMASSEADQALAPAPVTEAEVVSWTTGIAEQATRTASFLDSGRLSEPHRRALAQACERLAQADRGLMPSVHEPGTAMSAIRIHGDYHLGQTLKTREGFALIDFEGEPTRPLAERRRKHSALKDVAGMLRSFEYAVAVACDGIEERIAGVVRDLPLAEAFLEGYFSTTGPGAIFLPADPRARSAWIRVFEIEKALYELEYELNNRPDWVHIPASGLLRLVDA